MASTAGFSKYQAIAFILSPLCPLLFLLAHTLTEDRYRLNPWISVTLGAFSALLFSMSVLVFQSRGAAYFGRFVFLLIASSIWITATLLGLFSVLVADDPSWFH